MSQRLAEAVAKWKDNIKCPKWKDNIKCPKWKANIHQMS